MRYAVTVVLGMQLAACTTLPTLPQGSGALLKDVVDRVQCQFHEARRLLKEEHIDLAEWHGTFELTVQVTNTGIAGVGTDLVVPVTAGTVTPGFELGLETKSTRSVLLKFDVDFTEQQAAHCLRTAQSRAGRTGLDGDLGILEALIMAARAIDRRDVANALSIAQRTEFIVTAKADAHLGFVLARPRGSTGGVVGQTTTHILNAAFSPVDKQEVARSGSRSARAVARTRNEEALRTQTLQFLRVQ